MFTSWLLLRHRSADRQVYSPTSAKATAFRQLTKESRDWDVPILRVGDTSIFFAFIQAYRYDSMLTVIESNLFGEFLGCYFVFKPFACNLGCVKLYMSSLDLKGTVPSRLVLPVHPIPRFLVWLGRLLLQSFLCRHEMGVLCHYLPWRRRWIPLLSLEV